MKTITKEQYDTGCYEQDENCNFYVTSPRYDYTLDTIVMMLLTVGIVPGIALCLSLGGL